MSTDPKYIYLITLGNKIIRYEITHQDGPIVWFGKDGDKFRIDTESSVNKKQYFSNWPSARSYLIERAISNIADFKRQLEREQGQLHNLKSLKEPTSKKAHPIYDKAVTKILEKCVTQKEEIITAFIAKYGCGPEEVEQIQGYDRYGLPIWSVRKKGTNL